jgi:hypothetical protein
VNKSQCPHLFEGVERLESEGGYSIVHCVKCGQYGVGMGPNLYSPVEHLFWSDDPFVHQFLFKSVCDYLRSKGYDVDDVPLAGGGSAPHEKGAVL